MDRPRISLVTICLNQVDFVAQTIKSVLEQGYQPLQYIVIDGGSTDGSRERILQTVDKTAELVFEPDNGPPDALNHGLARSDGEIFCYLNSDDILLPGALDRVSRAFAANPSVDILLGDGIEINAAGEMVRRIYSMPWNLHAYLLGQCGAIQPSTFIRMSAMKRVNGFNVENRTSWDGELLVDLNKAGARFGLLRKPLSGFRIHAGSITGSGRLKERYAVEHERMFRKVLGRSYNASDRVWRELFRVRRGVLRPVAALDRVIDKFTGGYRQSNSG